MPKQIRASLVRPVVAAAVALLFALLLTQAMAEAARLAPVTGPAQRPAARPGTYSPVAAAPVATRSYTIYLGTLFAAPGQPITPTCPTITDWKGEYWANPDLAGEPALCRNDSSVHFDWGFDSPASSIPAESFSARWTRTLPFAAGRYRFHLAGDDGLRLWIDNKQVIDAWTVQARTAYTVEPDLTAGPHDLKVEFNENLGAANVTLGWEGPLVPNPCPAYQAQYFNNSNLSGSPVFTQCETAPINYNWGTAGPGHGLGSENFSVRWTGRFHIDAGSYTFLARTDDGLRAWVGNDQVVDAWIDQAPTNYRAVRSLAAGDYDVRAEYYQKTGAAVAQFQWTPSTPGAGIVVSQKHAFDKCQAPGTADLQTWWNKSPYWEYNIYIGGSLRFCSQPNLTPEILNAAGNQGWNFIPTWVGPQAPCTGYEDRMSADPLTAYNQGRSEADAASGAAADLDLTSMDGPGGSTVIYYDMEYYNGDTACRDAVKSFLSGWTGRLHELGLRSGVYGTPNGVYIPSGIRVDHTADDVWAASWITTTYDSSATVWNLPSIPNSLWAHHQRIHQYTGGHDERWGNIVFNIDSNVVDGRVAGVNPHPITLTVAGAPRAESAQAPKLPPSVQTAQLLPAGQGWALVDGRLLWTENSGGQWKDISPSITLSQTLRAAHFYDAQHGWILISAPGAGPAPTGVNLIARTDDGGQSWHATPLPALFADPGNLLYTGAYFDFVDAQTGWLALQLPSSSNFSMGALFGTIDGGRTWHPLPLPIGAQVYFTDALNGWTAGGAAGAELYATDDGGRSWGSRSFGVTRSPNVPVFYDLPTFQDPQHGVLPVTIADPQEPRVEFYRTADAGRTWQLAGITPVSGGAPGAKVPVSVQTALTWLVADPTTGELMAAGAPGFAPRPRSATTDLQGATNLQFAGAANGWAMVAPGSCSGDKQRTASPTMEPLRCAAQTTLLGTQDGGRTWTRIAP